MTMAGFHRRVLVLEFEDPSWNGFEVKMRTMNVEELGYFEGLRGIDMTLPENEAKRIEVYEFLSPKIISWNLLDDNDEPVPTSAEQLAKEDWGMIKAITSAWYSALVLVPIPLSKPSSDGDRLAGLDIPMAPIESSESLPSSSTPSE